MSRLHRTSLSACVLMFAASLAGANGAPLPTWPDAAAPRQQSSPATSTPASPFRMMRGPGDRSLTVHIRPDAASGKSQLIIPRAHVATSLGTTDMPVPGPRGETMLPTVMAGLALAVAILFGGLWLARRQGRVSAPVAAGVGLAAGLLLAGGVALANAPVPIATFSSTGVTTSVSEVLVSDSAQSIELHLTREQWEALGLHAGKGAARPLEYRSPDVQK